jgi:hypothetical protein
MFYTSEENLQISTKMWIADDMVAVPTGTRITLQSSHVSGLCAWEAKVSLNVQKQLYAVRSSQLDTRCSAMIIRSPYPECVLQHRLHNIL